MSVWNPSGTLLERVLKMNKVSEDAAKTILARVTTKAKKLKPRFVIYGREGVGKTSFPAFMSNPLFLMSQGETGLETLVANNQLGEIPHLPEFKSWSAFREAVKALIKEEHDYKTIVFDCLDGFETLLFNYIRDNQFSGSDQKFNHYRKGQIASMPHFKSFLNDLDRLRRERECTIVLLAHSRIATRTNPLGIDVTAYEMNVDKGVAPLVKGWADCMLFMNFLSTVNEDGKGTGGSQRVCYCNPSDSYDAKSRVKMPDCFSLGSTPEEGYNTFLAHYKKGKE